MRISDWSSDVCSSDEQIDAHIRSQQIDRCRAVGCLDRPIAQLAEQFADEQPHDRIVEFIFDRLAAHRSEEHTSELQSLMRISYAVFCLKKKNNILIHHIK